MAVRSTPYARPPRRGSKVVSAPMHQAYDNDVHSSIQPASTFATDDDSASDTDITLYEDHIDLDEEYDFSPKPGDSVWVKSKSDIETWYQGVVLKGTRSGTVRQGKQGIFYSVRYRHNLRRYFAPLLGDIKPDTPHVRRLLKQAGLLDGAN